MHGTCRHCSRASRRLRPRRLCCACYADPLVRGNYPRREVRRGVPDFFGHAPPPGQPTDAPAGTLAKLRVLAARAARGETLFHPLDNPETGRGRDLAPFVGAYYDGGPDNGLGG